MAESTERTFVFADLAGYAALTEAHGDERSANTAGRFHEIVRRALSANSWLVKTMGDGVMIVANSPEEGARVALTIARGVDSEHEFPSVRIGVHAGPAVEKSGDFFGGNINLTARLMEAAKTGQILVAEPIACKAGQTGAFAVPLGTMRLKHIAHPVSIYELEQDNQQARNVEHLDPVCQMRLQADQKSVSIDYGDTRVHFCSEDCAERFQADPSAYALDSVPTAPTLTSP